MSEVRVRFAPSPTGPPHVGTIRTGLFNWLFARHMGGKFILRIEDTDREREAPGAFDQLLEALRWLGCEWDEGPEVGGPAGPYIQSERGELYRSHAGKLLENGWAYKCWCPPERLEVLREQQRAQNEPVGYDRLCLNLSDDEKARNEAARTPFVVRLKVRRDGKVAWEDVIRGRVEFEGKMVDDQVLLKADGWPTYHLANVVDDFHMGITHVVRGEDWISSTPKHLLLYEAFGWAPPEFAHLSLVLGPDRSKLSKRHGTTNFMEFIEAGYLPEALVNFLALVGWSPGGDDEILTAHDIIERFSLEACQKHGAVFDIDKLKWMNGHYIRHLSIEDLSRRCLPYLQTAGLMPTEPTHEQAAYMQSVVALEHDRLKLLSEIPEATDFFFVDEPIVDQAAWDKWMGRDYIRMMLESEGRGFLEIDDWHHDTVERVVRGVIASLGVKPAEVIHPTRVAVSGRTTGPGLFELIAVLGRERILARIRKTLERL